MRDAASVSVIQPFCSTADTVDLFYVDFANRHASTHKYFFSNRVVEIWNALIASSSSNVFKRMLDCVDLAKLSL